MRCDRHCIQSSIDDKRIRGLNSGEMVAFSREVAGSEEETNDGHQRDPFSFLPGTRQVFELDVMMTGGERDGLQCVICGQDIVGTLGAAFERAGAPAVAVGIRDQKDGRVGEIGFDGQTAGERIDDGGSSSLGEGSRRGTGFGFEDDLLLRVEGCGCHRLKDRVASVNHAVFLEQLEVGHDRVRRENAICASLANASALSLVREQTPRSSTRSRGSLA